jgi:hypothetical protein
MVELTRFAFEVLRPAALRALLRAVEGRFMPGLISQDKPFYRPRALIRKAENAKTCPNIAQVSSERISLNNHWKDLQRGVKSARERMRITRRLSCLR